MRLNKKLRAEMVQRGLDPENAEHVAQFERAKELEKQEMSWFYQNRNQLYQEYFKQVDKVRLTQLVAEGILHPEEPIRTMYSVPGHDVVLTFETGPLFVRLLEKLGHIALASTASDIIYPDMG